MKIGQKHLIKAFITLQRVNILVKFPCSLVISLKSQKNHVVCNKMFELRNGLSIINQTLETEVEVKYIAGKYQQKKICLTIDMVAVNGKIPGGSVTVNPTAEISTEIKLSLQKFPDKNACVFISQRFQVISSQPLQDQTNKTEYLQIAKYRFQISDNSSNKNIHSSLGTSVADILHRSRQSGRNVSMNKNNPSRFRFSQVQAVQKNQTVVNQVNRFSWSKVQTNQKQKQMELISNNPRQRGYISQRMSINQDQRNQAVKSQYTINSMSQKDVDQVEEQKAKVFKLEKEKSEYIKQIAKLKIELQQVNQFQASFLQSQLERVQQENLNQSEEITNLKDALRDRQKKERDLILKLKQLKDENDKRKNKLNDSQSELKRLKTEFTLKQKNLTQTNQANKKIQEELQDLKLTISSQQKKFQLKQNSYKEQIKKINQKYSLSEAGRQKASLQMSNLLSEMQNSDRKAQFNMKEKEKEIIEERIKMNKKIDQISDQKKQMQEENSSAKQRLQQMEQEIAKIKKKLSEQSQNNQSLTIELRQCEAKWKNQKSQREQLERKTSKLQETLNNDKTIFQKKYQKLTLQLISTQSDLEKIKASYFIMMKKNEQLQEDLIMRKIQRQSLDAQLNELKKQNQLLTEKENGKLQLTETLNVQNQTNQHKFNDLVQQLQQQKERFQFMQQEYENQVKYLLQSNAYLEEDLNDFKQALDRESHKSNLFQEQSKKLNQQIFQLNRQLLQFVQKQNSLQSKLNQLQYNNKTYYEELSDLQTKNKELKTQLNEKAQKNQSLQKSHNKIELQKYLLEQKLSQLENNFQEKINSNKEEIKQKEKKHCQRSDEFEQLRKSNEEMRSNILQLKSEVNHCKTLSKLKTEETEEFKLGNEKLLGEIRKGKQELEDKCLEIFELRIQNDSMRREIDQRQRKITEMGQQKEIYRAGNLEALKQLFELLVSEQQFYHQNKQEMNAFLSKVYKSVRSQFKQFPDEQMSSLQLQMISKRNELLHRNNEKLQSLYEEIQMLEKELQRQSTIWMQEKQQMQNDAFNEREKLNALVDQKQSIINQRQLQNSQMQKVMQQCERQNEQLRQQVKRVEQMLDQISQQLKEASQQRDSFKEKIQSLYEDIHVLKKKEIKLNQIHQEEIKQMSKKLNNTINQIRSSNSQTESKYLNVTKTLIQKQQALQDIQKQLDEWKNKYVIETQKNENNQKLIRAYQIKYDSLEQSTAQLKKELNDVYQLYDTLKHENESNRQMVSQLEGINKRLIQQVKDVTVSNQELDFQLRQQTHKIQHLLKQPNTLKLNLNLTEDQTSKDLENVSQNYHQLKSQYESLKLNQQRLSQVNEINELTIMQITLLNKNHQTTIKDLQTQIHTLKQKQKLQLNNNQFQTQKQNIKQKEEQPLKLKPQLKESQEIASKKELFLKEPQVKQQDQNPTQNQRLIIEQAQKLTQKQTKIQQLSTKLKSALQQLQKLQKQQSTHHLIDEKFKAIKSKINRFSKFSKDIDIQSKQLIQIAKRKSAFSSIGLEQPKGISDILRQVALLTMKTKTKLLMRCQNNKDKQLIMSDYRTLQEKLQNAMKSHGVLKPMGFH